MLICAARRNQEGGPNKQGKVGKVANYDENRVINGVLYTTRWDDWGVIGHRVSVVGVGAAVTRSQVQAQASFEL